MVEARAEMPHFEATVAVEAARRGVEADRAAVPFAYEVGERTARVAAHRDHPRDGRHRADRARDGEDPVEAQVVEAARGVPVDTGVGLQVVVHEQDPVDHQQGPATEEFDPVARGLQGRGDLVEVVAEPRHRHPAEVGAHHRLVARVRVRAGVAEPGPARRDRQMGVPCEVRVRVHQAEPERAERGQSQRPPERLAAPVEHVSAGVRRQVAGAQGPRVRHGADTESVDDDDDGPAHHRALPCASYRPVRRGDPDDRPATTATVERVTKICVRNASSAVSPAVTAWPGVGASSSR